MESTTQKFLCEKFLQSEISRLSKRKRIEDAVLKVIEAGFLRPGDRIPTEFELAELLSVSLGTVQKALNELADQGVLNRTRKRGSFVADVQETGSDIWHMRFRRPGLPSLLPFETISISVEVVTETGPWSNFLGPSPDYIRINRLVRVDNTLPIWNPFYLAADRFRPLLDFQMEALNGQNLRHVLHDRFHAPTFRATRSMECREFPGDVCGKLGVPEGTAGMIQHVGCFTFRDQPLSFQIHFVPPNPFIWDLC